MGGCRRIIGDLEGTTFRLGGVEGGVARVVSKMGPRMQNTIFGVGDGKRGRTGGPDRKNREGGKRFVVTGRKRTRGLKLVGTEGRKAAKKTNPLATN